MSLSSPLDVYLAIWTTATVAAIVVVLHDPRIVSEAKSYLIYIMMPWKIAVLIPAALFVTFAGQFAFDDTWDLVTGGGMSVLTYMTAPWAVGTVFLFATGQRRLRDALIALVACLFSASWFYDGWLLYRDGYYSPMWLPNLLLSPFLYVAAGILWNLELDSDGKPLFGFFRYDWPTPPTSKQVNGRLAMVCLPPIVVVATVLLFCVKWRF